jgi:uncharacterized protein (DUF2062 family)
VEPALEWLSDTLVLFNMNKIGKPLLPVALFGRLYLIAVVVLVPMAVVAEVAHGWRRRRRSSRQVPAGKSG